MSLAMLNEVLKKVSSLPPLPAAVSHLLRVTNDTRANFKDISRIISTDQALTSRLLRIANSAYYGLQCKVSTVPHAIAIIGLDAVRNLALGFSIFGFKSGSRTKPPIDREEFWRHSLAVACATRLLAIHMRIENPEEAFVAGIMHDIGKVILMDHFTKQYEGALKEVKDGRRLLFEAEKDAYGIDHAAAGKVLCDYWKIPAMISNIIADHHYTAGTEDVSIEAAIAGAALTENLSQEIPELPIEKPVIDEKSHLMIELIRAADCLAKIAEIGSSGDPHVDPDFLDILSAEGIATEQLHQIFLVLPDEISNIAEFFNLESKPIESRRGLRAIIPSAAVLVENHNVGEMIKLALINMGFTIAPIDRIVNDDAFLSGIICDDSVSESAKRSFSERGIEMLDVAKWFSENIPLGSPAINISKLKRWMRSGLKSEVEFDVR